MNLKKDLINGVKGFMMGAANVVPGVSGGTVALISGIYTELIDSLNAMMSVSTWKKLFKEGLGAFLKEIHAEFLISLGLGVVISVFTIAKLVGYTLSYWPVQTWAFFFGLIIASAVVMLKDIKGWKWQDIAMTLVGLVLGLIVCTLSPTETPSTMWFLAICGAMAISTMILPGISGSFILVIMGKYDFIMNAIDTLNIPVLAVFAVGCGIGILAFAKFLHWLLDRWERQTLLVLVGFVVGSLVKVWPWNDMEAVAEAQVLRGGTADPVSLQIPSAVAFIILGIAVIAFTEFLVKRKTASGTDAEDSAGTAC